MEFQVIEHLKAKVVGVSKKVKKIASDDPRRILHSLKVGLALTLISTFYYLNPIYDGFGVSTMWAALTVVVVMEYTVGGTLGKGLNRAFATLLAGALGVGAHYLALFSGERGEPILLGCFVFLLAAAATFSRFIPEIKAMYDYGVLIFILTFSFVAVSSYRVDELIVLAHQRLSTVAIGGACCIIISVCLCPVWAGGELHDLVCTNLENLSINLEGLSSEYFLDKEIGDMEENKFHHLALQKCPEFKRCRGDSENVGFSRFNLQANLARWEPGHGHFQYRHPWKQYLKIGALARQCACCIEVLHSHVSKSKLQVSSECQKKIQKACYEMCVESSKPLKVAALAIQTMTMPAAAETYNAAISTFTNYLDMILIEEDPLSEILHAATIASILTEVVICTQNISKSTTELARLADFKSSISHPKATMTPNADEEARDHISVTIEK